MFSVLCFLACGAFELGHAEDTGALQVLSIVLYCIALYCIVSYCIVFRSEPVNVYHNLSVRTLTAAFKGELIFNKTWSITVDVPQA